MNQRDRHVHLQRTDQPALMLPVCGAVDFEHVTSDEDEVTCLHCVAFILRVNLRDTDPAPGAP